MGRQDYISLSRVNYVIVDVTLFDVTREEMLDCSQRPQNITLLFVRLHINTLEAWNYSRNT